MNFRNMSKAGMEVLEGKWMKSIEALLNEIFEKFNFLSIFRPNLNLVAHSGEHPIIQKTCLLFFKRDSLKNSNEVIGTRLLLTETV